jgi:hypothetical protein
MYYHFLPSAALWTHYIHEIVTTDQKFQSALPCLFINASVDFSTGKITSSSSHQSLGCFKATTRFSLDTNTELTADGINSPNQIRGKHRFNNGDSSCQLAGYSGTYYLLGNKNGLPLNSRSHLGNFYHFLVEYAGRIHVALIEAGITVENVQLLVESAHVLPPDKFVQILATSLGWEVSTSYTTLYKYIDQTSVCANQLVVGWPTWNIWWHLPNQQRWMDPSFAHGWDSLRLHLWRMLGLSLIEAEQKQRHSCVSNTTAAKSFLNVVYWSRGFGKRSVVNRNELADTLSRTFPNFKLVDPMPLTIAEQLAIVSTADVLVGPHGAGLSWTAAMRPQTAIVELTPLLFMRYELFKNVGKITGDRYYRHVPCDGFNISSTDPGLKGNLATRHKDHRMKCDPRSVLQATLDVQGDMLCWPAM